MWRLEEESWARRKDISVTTGNLQGLTQSRSSSHRVCATLGMTATRNPKGACRDISCLQVFLVSRLKRFHLWEETGPDCQIIPSISPSKNKPNPHPAPEKSQMHLSFQKQPVSNISWNFEANLPYKTGFALLVTWSKYDLFYVNFA